jgi:methionyl-tRNA formyltransferase
VVFAYHTIGARCLAALLDRGEHIALVVTHVEDPAEGAWFESVAATAQRGHVPVLTPSSPNTPDIEAAVHAAHPDILFSVWYRRLLGRTLLSAPRIAALNLHGSLLPAYRGRAPLNWVLVHGETRTGITLHHMTDEADAGDIVGQEAIDITPEDTARTLYERMVSTGVDLLVRTYPKVLAGVAPRLPQDPARATVFGRRRPEDGRVDWCWEAARIVNMVRAVTHPFPGAFVGDGPHRLVLWDARAVCVESTRAAPGTLLAVQPGGGIVVATGGGGVLISRMQVPGTPEEPADAWAQRIGVRPGCVLPADAHACGQDG